MAAASGHELGVGTVEGEPRTGARGVLFADANPEAAARGHVCEYPQSQPQGTNPDKAVKDSALIIATNDELSIDSAGRGDFGTATQDQVTAVENLLLGQKMIKKQLPWTDYFDDEFIKAANDGDVNQIQESAKTAKPADC